MGENDPVWEMSLSGTPLPMSLFACLTFLPATSGGGEPRANLSTFQNCLICVRFVLGSPFHVPSLCLRLLRPLGPAGATLTVTVTPDILDPCETERRQMVCYKSRLSENHNTTAKAMLPPGQRTIVAQSSRLDETRETRRRGGGERRRKTKTT